MRQFLYVSRQNVYITPKDLVDLLRESRTANELHKITGVLLYISGFFIQYLEGPADKVKQLTTNISVDKRNTGFTVLNDADLANRAFPNWSMGFKSYSIEEAQKEPGFLNINEENGLNFIKEHQEDAYSIMHAYYHSM